MTHEDSFVTGIRDGIPICLGYLSVSFAFGIFAVAQGLFPWEVIIISATNLTSAGQLAAVPIICGMLPFVELALSQLVINLRYALMSISLSQKFDDKVRLFDRFAIAFFNTDEIFAVASGKADKVGRHYMYGLGLTPFLGWTIGTTLGAYAGNILPDAVTNALGIAIYAMFIAIILPAAKKHRPVLICIAIATVLSIAFSVIPLLKTVSGGMVIIICAIVASTIMAVAAPVADQSEQEAARD